MAYFCKILLVCSFLIPSRSEDCVVKLKKVGFSSFNPQVTTETGDLILPRENNNTLEFLLGHEQEVIFSCPGSLFDNIPNMTGVSAIRARCRGEDHFYGSGFQGELTWNQVGSCRSYNRDVERVVGMCGVDSTALLVQIGYQVTEEVYSTVVWACHDLMKSRTLWTKHFLLDEIRAGESGRPGPFKPGLFYNEDIDTQYTLESQIAVLSTLLGSQDVAKKYVNELDFLNRGHLAPNGDLIFRSWRNATFHYINAAPQWKSFNEKNWEKLESGVRSLIKDKRVDVEVYTGTHGILELESLNNTQVGIYLNRDPDMGYRLPVPRFFWKIIHDRLSNSGVAAVGINNPYLSNLTDDYKLLCPALSQHPLLSLIGNATDFKSGYIYLCRVEDLAAAVPEVPPLPNLDLWLQANLPDEDDGGMSPGGVAALVIFILLAVVVLSLVVYRWTGHHLSCCNTRIF